MAPNRNGTILVTGATGQQGGAVARRLLDDGRSIRVLTRDRAKAADLADRGADVIEGDMKNRSALERALEGVHGVFAMTTPFEAGMEAEIEQGKTLADAAKAAGVRHYVFSSVGSAHRNTGIPHFETKWQVEQHIGRIGLLATVLRPVFFMENFLSPWYWPSIQNGSFTMPLESDTPLAMVALDDIGRFAAAAFGNPDRFVGEQIQLAGDEKTMPEVARRFSDALGHSVEFHSVPVDQAEDQIGEDMALMFRWFNETGYEVDVPRLEQQYGISLTSFDDWLSRRPWESV